MIHGSTTLVLAALMAAAPVRGQNRSRVFDPYTAAVLNPDGYYRPPDWMGNPLYDGRVTFARIKYRGLEHWADEGPGWSHDYPRAELHFDKIMRELTTMRLFVEKRPIYGSTIVALDDPELFKYPIGYLSEPGGWHMGAAEVEGLRKYISRGGFIIFDDMGCCGRQYTDLPNLVYEWQKAFPKAKLMPLSQDHVVFNAFFKINFAEVQGYYGRPEFYGFFEDNDPKKRLLAVINNNNDIGEYIEYSESGFNIGPTNEAYKLAVNYYIYALTH